MKKFIFAIMALLCMVACNPKKSETVPVQDETPVELIVGNTISTDRQYMFMNYGGDYRWYETCITLDDYLDSENCNGSIESISNVFQVVKGDSTSFDPYVIMSSYTRTSSNTEVISGFWVGDEPMNEEEINLTFKDAYEFLMEANCPKPHSRHCVLRKELGPKIGVAPQYIFGNQQYQVYVDAFDGTVTDHNPAFDD